MRVLLLARALRGLVVRLGDGWLVGFMTGCPSLGWSQESKYVDRYGCLNTTKAVEGFAAGLRVLQQGSELSICWYTPRHGTHHLAALRSPSIAKVMAL